MFEAVLALEAPAMPLPRTPIPVHAPDGARALFAHVIPLAHAAAPPAAVPLAPSGAAPPAFAAIRRRDLGARLAWRTGWALLAAMLEGIAAGAVVRVAASSAPPRPEAVARVEVQLPSAFPRASGPPRPPALPAAAAVPRARPAPAASVRKARPSPPAALLQPREVSPEPPAPTPGEPVEAWEPGGDPTGDGAATEEGVVGGVPGGEGSGSWSGAAAVEAAAAAVAAPRPAAEAIEDAPRWATGGFRKPAEEQPGCVARSVRLPRELNGFTSGPIVVRFAVLASGAVDRIELLGEAPDARVADAIARAVRGCRWRAGADAQGRAVALWVVLPLRFEGA